MPYRIDKRGSVYHLVNTAKGKTVSRHATLNKAKAAKRIREEFHRKGK